MRLYIEGQEMDTNEVDDLVNLNVFQKMRLRDVVDAEAKLSDERNCMTHEQYIVRKFCIKQMIEQFQETMNENQ